MKSNIPTLEQIIQIDKEVERQKSKIEKKKVATKRNILLRVEDCEEDSSSSSMLMYNLDSSEKCVDGGKNPSQQRETLPVPQVQIRLTNVWYGRIDEIMDSFPSKVWFMKGFL